MKHQSSKTITTSNHTQLFQKKSMFEDPPVLLLLRRDRSPEPSRAPQKWYHQNYRLHEGRSAQCPSESLQRKKTEIHRSHQETRPQPLPTPPPATSFPAQIPSTKAKPSRPSLPYRFPFHPSLPNPLNHQNPSFLPPTNPSSPAAPPRALTPPSPLPRNYPPN